jgi:hypothetical protein
MEISEYVKYLIDKETEIKNALTGLTIKAPAGCQTTPYLNIEFIETYQMGSDETEYVIKDVSLKMNVEF